jgi:mycoredoxin-dependent peroxiredoxin
MAVEVGSQAPDFTTRNSSGEEVTLSSFRGGKAVLLVFYPFAFSPVCSGELCQVREDLPRFQNDDVQILPISTDPTYTLKAWAKAEHFDFPLLSDFWPHGAIASSYGVFDPDRGCAVRGTFVIDRSGLVRWSVVNAIADARHLDDYAKALAGLDTDLG